MIKKTLWLALLVLCFSVPSWGQGANTIILRFAAAPTGSCAPVMLAVDGTTGDMYDCLLGAWFKIGPGAAASASWSSLTPPTLNTSISMAGFTTTFTYNATTGPGVNLFSITDTLNNTGTGILFHPFTASGSALTPFQTDANGNGFKVTTAGLAQKVGTGGFDWPSLLNFPAACAASNAVTAVGVTLTCNPFMSNPMTTLGDVVYGGASGVPTRLAGNITTTKQFLSQTGTGTVSAAPTWAALAAGDIPDLSGTYQVVSAKNAANGYAGLTASTKLVLAHMQEVMGVADLTDYTGKSGTGTTAIGSTVTTPAVNDVLTWNGTNWINQTPSGGTTHNLLSTTHPDTLAASPILGDLIIGNVTPAWARLAGNTTTTKQFLTSTGTGAASAVPVWAVIAAGDIPDLSATYQLISQKNAASGYAGLTAGTKLNLAQMQEVMAAADLSDFTAKDGAGTTILGTTITTPAANQVICRNGTNTDWVNCTLSDEFSDSLFRITDDLDATKKLAFEVGALTTATVRTVTAPDANTVLVVGSSAPANQFATGISATLGTISYAQPAFSNLSGAAAKNQLPATVVYTDQANTLGAFAWDASGASATQPVKTGTVAGAPATCVANKELYIETDATPTGQQLFICNATGNGWVLVGDGGAGSALGDPGANGMVARTALNTTAARTLTGTASQIGVTNGDGVAGNPVFALADPLVLPGNLSGTQKANGDTFFSTKRATDTAPTGNFLDFTDNIGTGHLWQVDITGSLVAGSVPGARVSGNIAGNAANVTGTVAIANGGTGQTTASTAFDALAPSTTRGDIIARGLSGNIRLALGSAGKCLRSDGTDAIWSAANCALTSDTLAVFAATTSAQLAGVLSDETGSGLAVFATSPTLTTPVIASIVNTGTLTLPTSTDTLVGRATTDTLTNKTLDAEGTGNVLTTVSKIWLPAAVCQNATATLNWDTPTTNPAVAACVTGTNTQKGVADFADGANALSMQMTLMLPSDWTATGGVDAQFKWLTTAIAGNVVWQIATVCVADAETDDPAFNAASTVTDAAKGVASQTNDATITGVTMTGCAAGELLHLKVLRDPANASDTLAATARLIGVMVTLRRAQ